ncbi:MAG: ankyrin repeat domain-containing protein [Spirochaetales bacterium]|nr:ankyrin repeat domain-containing protein [Spirochaetales bacterium]
MASILLFVTGAVSSQEKNNLNDQLYKAVIEGDTRQVQTIVDKGINIDSPLKDEWTPLMLAVEHEKSEIVSLLLKSGADVNKGKGKAIGGFSGGLGQIYIMTPLYLAADKNNFEIARMLVEYNAEVYHPSECRILSVLFPVIKHGNREILEFLLQKGLRKDYFYQYLLVYCLLYNQNTLFKDYYNKKDVEKLDFDAKFILEEATIYNNVDIICFLIEKGIHKVENNALHIAIEYGYTEIAKYLIENDVDINSPDKDARVPLYYAIRKNNGELISLLLKHRASIKTQNSDENDFLHLAVLNGNRTLIVLLLEKGVAVNTRNTALTIKRIVFNGDKVLLQLMLKKGLKLHGLNPGRDESLLYLALKEEYKDIAVILLSGGVEPDEASVELTIQKGHTDLVKIFIDRKYAFTTDHLNKALRERQHDISILLIESGVEVNVSEVDYADTPLKNAVQQEYYDIVELLLNKGADVNHLTKSFYDGHVSCLTALDFAQSEPMRTLLIKHGAIPATAHPDYEPDLIPYESLLGDPEMNSTGE